jgi:chemotaxis protein histidine kinase CheA
MDMDKLQNQTATATNAMEAARHTKVEEYARNIAEGGMRRIFRSCLRLHVKHQDKPRTIRLRGEWVEMDPRSWHAEMDVTINTGLGSGSRDRDLQLLMGIAAKQELVHQAFGPQVAHKLGVGPNVIFDTYRMMVEAAGIRSPERFFPELSKEEIDAIAAEAMKNQPPDPKMLELQAKGQMEQQKLQAQQQMEAAKLQAQQQVETQKAAQEQQFRQMEFESTQRSEQMKLEREAMIEERQAQADIAVKEREAAAKAALEQQKFEFQKELEVLKFELERELKQADMQMKQADMQANMQMKAQDMELRGHERREIAEQKAKEANTPKASIKVKHDASEAAGPIGEMLAPMMEQMGKRHEELLSHLAQPKPQRKGFNFKRDPQTNKIVGADEIYN